MPPRVASTVPVIRSAKVTGLGDVPDGADAVVKVEDTSEENGHVLVRAGVRPGTAVREPGEDVRAGEVVVIPSNVPHGAVALEDTLDVDVFCPPRQDWLAGTDAYLRG